MLFGSQADGEGMASSNLWLRDAEKLLKTINFLSRQWGEPYLRKIQPQVISDKEKAVIDKYINKLKNDRSYIVDVKGKIISNSRRKEKSQFTYWQRGEKVTLLVRGAVGLSACNAP
jgi:hypothetical protein